MPEIKTAKDFLQKMASDINSMNLSSCQVAQGLVGGLFPQTQESQQKVCQDIGSESNIFADWAASRQGCTVGGQSSSVRDKASDKDKERVLKNQNIIWEALKKNRMFDGNKELKEFIMTLTGTLIFGEDSEITPCRRVPLTAISSGRLWRGNGKNLPLQRFGQVSEGGGGCKCDHRPG